MLMPVVRALIAAGADYRASLAAAGLKLEDLERASRRIPHVQAIRFLEDAVERSGDPGFGLTCGLHTDLSDLGLFGMLLATAPTFGDSVRRVQRFGKLLHDAAHDFGEQIGELYYWYMDLPGVDMPMPCVESVVAASVARIRFWAGPEWVPRQVWFRHAEPAYSETYRRLFRCDVRFGAPHIAVVIDASMMDEKNMTDSSISTLIERRAEAALDELTDERSFTSRVRDQILRSLGTESVGAEALSRRLHVSRATLTRKLAQEQTTLSDVLGDVRRDLAIEYLRDGNLSVEEIARRLAFSDARAFRRAFQRWTGSSPADFRTK